MQQRTNEEKEELVQLYKQSGMSARAFAKEFEINLGTFRNWLYKKPSKNISTDNNYKFVKMEQIELLSLLNNLISQWENELVEFKQANKDFKLSEIGQYFSALSNEANLRKLEKA